MNLYTTIFFCSKILPSCTPPRVKLIVNKLNIKLKIDVKKFDLLHLLTSLTVVVELVSLTRKEIV